VQTNAAEVDWEEPHLMNAAAQIEVVSEALSHCATVAAREEGTGVEINAVDALVDTLMSTVRDNILVAMFVLWCVFALRFAHIVLWALVLNQNIRSRSMPVAMFALAFFTLAYISLPF
jgi:hypothetical protein